MCGINGIVNLFNNVESQLSSIKNMNSAIKHRGPDGEGVYVSFNKHVAFGNRRLSIVDVKRGNQPMVLFYNNCEFAVTFNGEIYNHLELKIQLQKLGHKFKTNSDTEVLLKSYIEWGEKCVGKFNGIFAFAIYDGKNNQIFLARDRVGIKPLYYAIMNHTLIFSSEPKGILAYLDFKKEPDNETIAEFFLSSLLLADGSTRLNRSFFKGLYALEPGKYAFFSAKGLQVKEYWDVPKHQMHGGSLKISASQLRKTLSKAIALEIPREVKFGSALSGGIDSSIVTTIAAEKVKNKLSAASITFKNAKHNPDFEHAKLLAKAKHLKLLKAELTPRKMIADIDRMIKAMDQPHDTIRQLGLLAVYRTLHKSGCKVALVGEGSDEFNLGYYYTSPGFDKDLQICKNSREFRKIWKRRAIVASKYFDKRFLSSVDFDEIIEYNLKNYYEKCKSKNKLARMEYFYIKKFLKYRLDANDTLAMAFSIEARVPFCDHNYIEAALQVPPEINLKNGLEKMALRTAFEHKLPKSIANRQKYPLPESRDILMHKLVAQELDKNIKKANSGVWKILDKQFVFGLNQEFKLRIAEIENKKRKFNLTQEILFREEINLRSKHIFLLLTFLRWYKLNFTN